MNVLGIDYGPKHTGLAIVDDEINEVLHLETVHLRDDVSDKLKGRATNRRVRRNRKRYRKPKIPQRYAVSSRNRQTYKLATGLNKNLHTKCKHVDKETGEICGKNTPMKKNVRHLLLQNILNYSQFKDFTDRDKASFHKLVDNKKAASNIDTLLEKYAIGKQLGKQVKNIMVGELQGRASFCRNHIGEYASQSDIESEPAWLPPSIKVKYEEILGRVKVLHKMFGLGRIVIERARFDIQLLRDPNTTYQEGPRSEFNRNTKKALEFAYYNHCCYCGKDLKDEKSQIEHVIPKKYGGGNNWDNLVLACKECNRKKGGRTAKEAGMSFAAIKVPYKCPLTGKTKQKAVKLEPAKSPINSRLIKYASQTDLGYRYLVNKLEEITACKVSFTFGYKTWGKRVEWEVDKDHHYDAAVIAATEKLINIREVAPSSTDYTKRCKGKSIHDLNPVRKDRKGKFSQRVPVRSLDISRVDKIIDVHKRTILQKLIMEHEIKRGAVPETLIEKVPFRSVRLPRNDVSINTAKKINNNYFKVCGTNYIGFAIYEHKPGKYKMCVLSNPKVHGSCRIPEEVRNKKFLLKVFVGQQTPIRMKDGSVKLGVLRSLEASGNAKFEVAGEEGLVIRRVKDIYPINKP